MTMITHNTHTHMIGVCTVCVMGASNSSDGLSDSQADL
jgi:hypothetical protein